jgi:hypothetical protein
LGFIAGRRNFREGRPAIPADWLTGAGRILIDAIFTAAFRTLNDCHGGYSSPNLSQAAND